MRKKWDRADWVQFILAGLAIPFGILARCAGILVLSIMFAVNLVAQRVHLRVTHNRAWLSGRIAMIGSILEAQRRNMALNEWLIAEAERDGFGAEFRAAVQGEAEEG